MRKALPIFAILLSMVPACSATAQGLPNKGQKVFAAQMAEYKRLKAAYTKNPKDAKARKKYVSATVTAGTATMTNADLPPRVKYADALRLYREALKLNPKNKEALKNKKMIEDIYVSMGRPIPK